MGNISDNIIEEIDRRKVEQVPGWRFTLNALFAWVGFVLLTLLGAHAVSVILYLITGQDWTGLGHLRGGWFVYAFSVLPYVWVAALILLVTIAYLDFRRTRAGYRHRPVAVVASVLAVSLLAGVGLHAVGLGERTDELLEGRVPSYRRVVLRGFDVWNLPSEGRLIGRVESVGEGGQIEILSPSGDSWVVIVDESCGGMPMGEICEGCPLRVIGRSLEDGTFDAEIILPWGPGSKSLHLPPRPAGTSPGMHLPYEDRGVEEDGHKTRIISERAKRPLVHPAGPANP